MAFPGTTQSFLATSNSPISSDSSGTPPLIPLATTVLVTPGSPSELFFSRGHSPYVSENWPRRATAVSAQPIIRPALLPQPHFPRVRPAPPVRGPLEFPVRRQINRPPPFPPGVVLHRPGMPIYPEPPQVNHLQALHSALDNLQRSLALEVRCSRNRLKEEKNIKLTHEIDKIIESAHSMLSIKDQASIYMHVAILYQYCKCYESARHYLLTCSGFLTQTATSQEAYNISNCICHHTTLLRRQNTAKKLSPVMESVELSRYIDDIKIEGMVRLAWNNAQLLLEQIEKEGTDPSATQQTSSTQNHRSFLHKSIDDLVLTNRCHQLPPVLHDLFAEARCVQVTNSQTAGSAAPAQSQ